eukprot:365210-Chlamydomonas_euryale.AAC.7
MGSSTAGGPNWPLAAAILKAQPCADVLPYTDWSLESIIVFLYAFAGQFVIFLMLFQYRQQQPPTCQLAVCPSGLQTRPRCRGGRPWPAAQARHLPTQVCQAPAACLPAGCDPSAASRLGGLVAWQPMARPHLYAGRERWCRQSCERRGHPRPNRTYTTFPAVAPVLRSERGNRAAGCADVPIQAGSARS